MPWFVDSFLPHVIALVRVRDRFVDAVLRGAERRGGLADAVLVHEVLGELEAVVEPAEHGVAADADVGERHLGVVARHVERPPVELDLEPRCVARHEERGDARRGLPGSPEVRAKMMSCVAMWTPVFQRFIPLITHSSPSRTAVVSRNVASLPWFGSVRPNASRRDPSRKPGIHSAICSAVPKSRIISTVGKLPTIDDSFCRSLCRPRPRCARCSRMIAISRLLASRPPNSAGSASRSQPGGVGAPAHLAQQLLPLLARHAVVLEVGARPLAPVVEEAHVVVLRLERDDLALDERVEPIERRLDVGRDREVHGCDRTRDACADHLPRSTGHVPTRSRPGRQGAERDRRTATTPRQPRSEVVSTVRRGSASARSGRSVDQRPAGRDRARSRVAAAPSGAASALATRPSASWWALAGV